jgi:hypothetical protein
VKATIPFQVVRKMSASENAKGYRIFDNDSHYIADVTPWDEDGIEGGKLANLFAAAPSLLAMCKRALHLVEENNEEIVMMPGSFGLMLDLSEAIAKAEQPA